MNDYKNKILNDKRKSSAIFATLLVVIPFLTMNMWSISDSGFSIGVSFMDILRPEEVFPQIHQLKVIVYPLIALSLISITLSLVTKPIVILSVIFGILALCIHIVFYSMNVMVGNEVASVSFSLGISWYLMGIGYVLLVVSPFLKKSS